MVQWLKAFVLRENPAQFLVATSSQLSVLQLQSLHSAGSCMYKVFKWYTDTEAGKHSYIQNVLFKKECVKDYQSGN